MTENAATLEILQFIAIMIALPYVVSIPLTVVWFGVGVLVWKVTGWKGLMPADIWHEMERHSR